MNGPSSFAEELSKYDLETGAAGTLSYFWRDYQSNSGVEGDWLRPYLPRSIVLEPTARADDIPVILHVGSETLMAEHVGESWSSDPQKWNVFPDRNLARLASTGFEPVIEDSEPTYYCFGIDVDFSTRGRCFVVYERLAVIVRSPSLRCRRLLTFSSALDFKSLYS